MSTRAPASAGGPAGSIQGAVRRLVVFLLLLVLVIVAASGLTGLLGRLLDARNTLAGDGAAGLALWMAFTLIGGPLAAILGAAVWRRAADPVERASLGWGLYLAAVMTLSLAVAASSLLGTAASAVTGSTGGWASGVAAALVWGGVWWWHLRMWGHPAKGPLLLATLPMVFGALFGLVVGAVNAARLLEALFETALRGAGQFVLGRPWWSTAVEALVWLAGGAVIWWWHWFRRGARSLSGGFADVALVLVGVLAAVLAALGGAGTILFVLLRLLADRTTTGSVVLAPVPLAAAAALTGGLVWAYHRPILALRAAPTRRAGLLVVCGAALAGAATGLGIVVNALLSTAGAPLAGPGGSLTLLLAGVSALAVGGPVWWLAWRTVRAEDPDGRRVYLVAVFGLSAVTALVTLLVVGYRLFEFLLGGVAGTGLVERVRAPLGLLAATALVAGYHFAVWRRDRAVLAARAPLPPEPPGAGPRVGHVLLLAGYDAGPLAEALRAGGERKVSLWRAAPDPSPGREDSTGDVPGAGAGEPATAAPLSRLHGPGEVLAALSGLDAPAALVSLRADGGIGVVPLERDPG
ncbi:DUF5671 domain-containing protein [Zafaria sp. Z1313]|uniref:DUF5671 domain-containing protein n=1 Tax=Zafaria sp. Z1313 TaxID=3423202 RepID=UPI003D303084